MDSSAASVGALSRPPRARRAATVVVATVVGLAVLLGGGVLGHQLWRVDQQRQAVEAARIEHDRQAALAGSAVQSYFDALAGGDLETILSLGVSEVKASPLLAAKVVNKAVEAAPISDLTIRVGELKQDADGNYTTGSVAATYTMKGSRVDRSWTLTKVGEDWRFAKVTTTVDLTASEVAVKINGVAVKGSTVELLPGAYTLSTDDKVLSIEKGDFLVKAPGEKARWEPTTKIRPEAVAAAAKAVTASYRSCVAVKAIDDLYGCPFAFQDGKSQGITIVAGTFRISSKGNPFAHPKLKQTYGLEYSVTERITISAKASARQNGSSGTLTWEERTYQATATITLGSNEVLWEWD